MDALSKLPSYIPLPVQLGLAGVGAIYTAGKLWSFLQLVLGSFLLGGTSLRKFGKPGSWVVITGASDGLGKEYATQLAAQGYNLVLVSRTLSKLDALATEIQTKYANKQIQVKTLAMDFSQNNDSDYERLQALVAPLDVAILINNVGQSHEMPVPFLETSAKELQDIVTINCIGTLKATQAVAPVMQKRKQRSLILTMGSFAGWTPTPLLATYSGSKAFLQQWNTALASELSEHNIECQLVLSHLVTTAMSKVKRPSLLVPNARNFVRSALGKVGLGGYQASPKTYTPWWSHAFMLWVIDNIPGVNSRVTVWQNKNMHVDIRRRALRKKAREAKAQ
jgi:17beta-estradiol 17-dehydrogenase / very-long-chain 3-oxoacyl-CoA reductase